MPIIKEVTSCIDCPFMILEDVDSGDCLCIIDKDRNRIKDLGKPEKWCPLLLFDVTVRIKK